MAEHKCTNKLIQEKSPYLLQHAHNPVDWYPWGPEAFGRAAGEDKPVFLSIGYSTCHWCHVMERESFEDEEVARILNKHFIAIKVDREERPDIDHIYMEVCQALTGSGGWPLSIFLTPDKKPFFAGTYFPKRTKRNMAGLINILEKITDAWENNREHLIEAGDQILDTINKPDNNEPVEIGMETPAIAFRQFVEDFDEKYGGFGDAPKFPSPHNLMFLLRYWHLKNDPETLEMIEKTLDSMYRGGIYDHLGYGFSRYSTDRLWLVPHFEKMLYDNAMLAIVYVETYQALKKQQYANVANEIFTYVLRDMTSPEGGFYSAEDADSEGVEGKFYVWTPDEIIRILGEEEGKRFNETFGISKEGNFEGKNIPNLINNKSELNIDKSLRASMKKLFEHREKRIHPYKDDKILTSWNGMMIASLAIGGRILQNSNLTRAAEKAVQFIFKNLISQDGRLLARFRDGEAAFPAYLDDYSFLIWGLIELYETTYNPEYLKKALDLNEQLLDLFWDSESGGLFLYGKDGEKLITRPKEIYDGALPSGNSVAAYNFLRLARLTGRSELEDKSDQIMRFFGSTIKKYPRAFSFALISILYANSRSKEFVLVSEKSDKGTEEIIDLSNSNFNPFNMTINIDSTNINELKKIIPFLDNYKVKDGLPTLYMCEGFNCSQPQTDIQTIKNYFS